MRHILIAEDEPNLIAVLKELFQYEGFSVSIAKDGAQAIERLHSPPVPDVILLDLVMPRTNGWTVLRHLRRTPHLRGVPVLLLTAVYPEPSILPPREYYHALFQKPFDFDQLLAIASEVAEQRAARLRTEDSTRPRCSGRW